MPNTANAVNFFYTRLERVKTMSLEQEIAELRSAVVALTTAVKADHELGAQMLTEYTARAGAAGAAAPTKPQTNTPEPEKKAEKVKSKKGTTESAVDEPKQQPAQSATSETADTLPPEGSDWDVAKLRDLVFQVRDKYGKGDPRGVDEAKKIINSSGRANKIDTIDKQYYPDVVLACRESLAEGTGNNEEL